MLILLSVRDPIGVARLGLRLHFPTVFSRRVSFLVFLPPPPPTNTTAPTTPTTPTTPSTPSTPSTPTTPPPTPPTPTTTLCRASSRTSTTASRTLDWSADWNALHPVLADWVTRFCTNKKAVSSRSKAQKFSLFRLEKISPVFNRGRLGSLDWIRLRVRLGSLFSAIEIHSCSARTVYHFSTTLPMFRVPCRRNLGLVGCLGAARLKFIRSLAARFTTFRPRWYFSMIVRQKLRQGGTERPLRLSRPPAPPPPCCVLENTSASTSPQAAKGRYKN